MQVLKRTSRVMYDESFGSTRRIRHKPNHLSSRGLSLAIPDSTLSSSQTGLGFMAVPFKSSEMTSKILQQLDEMDSLRDKLSESKVLALMDKSPSKLPPSMLPGQDLKSHEEFTSRKEDKIKENGLLKDVSPDNNFITIENENQKVNSEDSRLPEKDAVIENAIDVHAGPSSSSQYAWDQSLSSRSKQGALKRTSSDMDSDTSSSGTTRRIHQKPNLLSSGGLSLAVPGSSLSSPRTGPGFEAAPISKPASFGEFACNFDKASAENGDNGVLFTTIPSKSSEMTSKVLQQPDKMVSPRDRSLESKVLALMDKSPSTLSPSMLDEQALKSLENVDSSKFQGDVEDGKKLDGLFKKTIPNSQEFTSQKENDIKENGPLKGVSIDDKFTASEDSRPPEKDAECRLEISVPAALNSVAYPPQKKPGFQTRALHEDFLDLGR